MIRYNLEGCRIDTLYGQWLCLVEHLDSWVNSAWAIVESKQLQIYQERSQSANDSFAEEPYKVDANGIARLQMSGPLTKYPTSFQSLFGGTSMMQMRDVLLQARNDPAVRGVYVDADSPGGTANGTPEMAEAIRRFAAAKPIAVHAEDLACSGMLWIATQAPVFTCGPMAQVGSLGTMARLTDSSQLAEKSLVKPRIFTTGKYKGIGAEGQPITKEHEEEITRLVHQINEPFKNDVAKARKLKPEQLKDIVTARVYVGQGAVDIGLVDRVCSADQAYEALTERVRTGSVTRGPVPGTVPVTAKRSKTMLTAEQLVQAKKLPGTSAITTENADELLLSAGLALQTANKDMETANTSLKTQLDAVQKQVPKVIDPQVLKDRALVAQERIDLLVEKQFILPAQATELKKLIIVGDQPSAAMLTPLADGSMPYVPMLTALQQNKPSGILDPKTTGQPAPRTEPGKDKPEDKPMTSDRRAELLGHVGIAPSNGAGK